MNRKYGLLAGAALATAVAVSASVTPTVHADYRWDSVIVGTMILMIGMMTMITGIIVIIIGIGTTTDSQIAVTISTGMVATTTV